MADDSISTKSPPHDPSVEDEHPVSPEASEMTPHDKEAPPAAVDDSNSNIDKEDATLQQAGVATTKDEKKDVHAAVDDDKPDADSSKDSSAEIGPNLRKEATKLPKDGEANGNPTMNEDKPAADSSKDDAVENSPTLENEVTEPQKNGEANGNPTVNEDKSAADSSKDGAVENSPALANEATEPQKNGEANGTATETKSQLSKDDEKSSFENKKYGETNELRHRDWREKRDSDNKARGTRNRRFHPYKEYRDRKKRNRNVKTKFEDLPESSDPDQIRTQVEFYFGDSNLPLDTYLLRLTGGPDNTPIPIKKIHEFKRMRRFQPYSAVVAALKESDKLVIHESEGAGVGEETVSRKVPLTAELAPYMSGEQNRNTMNDLTMTRSIYAKGFGDETSTTQFDVEAFFAPYGPFNAVRLRRTFPDKIFKGSVFVEFDSDETAQKFLAIESKPKWQGQDLTIKSKQDYVNEKSALFAKQREEGKGHRGNGRHGHGGRGDRRGRGRGRGGRRDDSSTNGYGIRRVEDEEDQKERDETRDRVLATEQKLFKERREEAKTEMKEAKDAKKRSREEDDDEVGVKESKNARKRSHEDDDEVLKESKARKVSSGSDDSSKSEFAEPPNTTKGDVSNGKRKRAASTEEGEAGSDHEGAKKKLKQ